MRMYKRYEIIENRKIAKDVYKLVVNNPGDMIRAGQFYMIKVPNKFLSRPISVCDFNPKTITFIYKIFGEGTKSLSFLKDEVEMLGALGSGWEEVKGRKIALIAGGVGTPAVYNIAKRLKENNEINIVLGFNEVDDIFYRKEFEAIAKTYIITEDGKLEYKGNVLSILDMIDFDYMYICGPNPMIKAVGQKYKTQGQVSLEEHMACGIGICGGCNGSLLSKEKDGKVCKEGPVFDVRSLDV